MNKRNKELDRLRGFAVILVVLVHIVGVFFPWSISRASEYVHGTTILNIWANSWTGVDLFFVISGFIISKTIVTQIDNLKNSSAGLVHFIKTFYLRRIYRIYPVAWVTFFFVLFCAFLFNKSGHFGTPVNTIEAGISIFTYTFNYFFAFGIYKALTLSPYWSLSVEEQFYLLLPLFLVLTKSNRQRAIIFIVLLLMTTFIIRPFAPESLFFSHTRCDGLIYGCLVYFLSQQTWFTTLFDSNEPSLMKIMMTTILIVVLSSVTAIGFSYRVSVPLACFISSLLVALAAMEKNMIISFYPIQVVVDYFGSRSYSLYIVHFPMLTLTQEIMYRLSKVYLFNIDASLKYYYLGMALTLTIVCTEFLYRYIETPFVQKGRLLVRAPQWKTT